VKVSFHLSAPTEHDTWPGRSLDTSDLPDIAQVGYINYYISPPFAEFSTAAKLFFEFSDLKILQFFSNIVKVAA
jgi:hypothetical protein